MAFLLTHPENVHVLNYLSNEIFIIIIISQITRSYIDQRETYILTNTISIHSFYRQIFLLFPITYCPNQVNTIQWRYIEINDERWFVEIVIITQHLSVVTGSPIVMHFWTYVKVHHLIITGNIITTDLSQDRLISSPGIIFCWIDVTRVASVG